MIINNNRINIFDPDYAFKRITNDESYCNENDFSALKATLKLRSDYELKLYTGAEFNYRERSYHKYPSNLAVLIEMQDMLTRVNQSVHNELKEMYRTPSEKEKNCIAFGLYYGYLKSFQFTIIDSTRPNWRTPFMHEFHTFIKEHPEIIDDYCKYMDFPPYECEMVKQLIFDNGLLRDRWIHAADDIL